MRNVAGETKKNEPNERVTALRTPVTLLRRKPLGVTVCLLLHGALGCSGAIETRHGDDNRAPNGGIAGAAGASGSGVGGNAGTAGPPTFGETPADPLSAGPVSMRLLTRSEYENTVRDLLGVGPDPAALFPSESQAETGFAKVQKVDQLNVAAYQDAALDLSAQVAGNLSSVLGCDPSSGDEAACIRAFLEAFGRRAYRRPLSETETAEHLAFYQDVLRSELALSVPEAAEMLIAALLQSPYFLYRWELGSKPAAIEGAVVKLNPHHLASRLSYFLWASMPDAELFAAADTDALQDEVQVEAQVRRMLADPKAERTVAVFHEQWLGLSSLSKLGKSGGLYPAWDAELGTAMAEEVRRFTTEILLRGDGRFMTLMTSRASFVNEPLAQLYGIPGVTGSDFVSRELPAAERSGLLTLAGFLTAHSGEVEGSPIFRGKFVRERFLCDPMSPPPANIPDLPAPDPNLRKRERYEEHSKVSPCSSCHLRMDYIGFAFDHFDAIGAFHALDGQFPIDATGIVSGLDGANPTFDGPQELIALLTTSPQVRACVTKEWFRYTFARREVDADRASLDAAYAAFEGADYNVRELLVAFAKTRSFRYRAASEGEVFE